MKTPTGLRSSPAITSEPTPAFDMVSSAAQNVSGATVIGERGNRCRASGRIERLLLARSLGELAVATGATDWSSRLAMYCVQNRLNSGWSSSGRNPPPATGSRRYPRRRCSDLVDGRPAVTAPIGKPSPRRAEDGIFGHGDLARLARLHLAGFDQVEKRTLPVSGPGQRSRCRRHKGDLRLSAKCCSASGFIC